MLGFNKCGKTALIDKFLADHYPKDHPPYIYLHLKEEQIGSMEDFLERLKEEILRAFGRNGSKNGTVKAKNKWGIKQVNIGGKFWAKIPGTSFEAELALGVILERMESKEYKAKKSLIRDLRCLIHDVKQKEKKDRPFLIVIDEINKLKDILAKVEDKQDLKLFKSLISRLEDVTKNKKTANVLFCSADSGVKFMFEGTGLGWDATYGL